MTARRVLALALVLGSVSGAAAAADVPGIKVGSRAPEFACRLLAEKGERKRVTLSSLTGRGRVVVLSFFHTQCKPCVKEIPRLTEVVGSGGDWPVSTYLVFVGTEDDGTVHAFMKKHGFSLPVLMDREGLWMGEKYGVVKNQIARVPQIVVISRNGEVKAAWTGFSAATESKLKSLLASLVAEKKAAAGANQLCLLFTNNTNGMTKPSGSGMGGLARREVLVERERAAGIPVVLLDSGDFMPASPSEERTMELVRSYRRMRYDAVTIGEAEFVNGLKFLRGLIEKKSLPIISSNVKVCQGEELCVDIAPGRLTITRGKFKIAVLGYMHKHTLGFTPRSRLSSGKWKVKIADHMPSLKGFVKSWRKKADVLVVLSHAGVDQDRKLARALPEIDVIVGGHSQTFLPKPDQVGNTLIVQAASDGQYVGKLVLDVGGVRPRLKKYGLIPVGKELDSPAK